MTCDHPECSDDEHRTYTDDHDNTLDLCEAHYYYLVSGKKPSSLKSAGGFVLDEAQPAPATGRASGFLDDIADGAPIGRHPRFAPERRER